MTEVCKLCESDIESAAITLRCGTSVNLSCCSSCEFYSLPNSFSNLIDSDEYDAHRLGAAGLDTPTVDEDFEIGLRQSKKYMKEFIVNDDVDSNVLEIGCSYGYFLNLLQDAGVHCYGLETNPVRSDYVNQKLKIKCYRDLSDIVNLDIKFKKIFMFYVIEHMEYPYDYILQLLDLLESGGSLIFITPNHQDALKDVWRNKAFVKFFHEKQSVSYFTTRSLEVMLKKLPQDKFCSSVKVKQGYSLMNHLSWFFTGKPSPVSAVGEDYLLDNMLNDFDSSNIVAQDIKRVLKSADLQYREVVEKHGLGNQVICQINKL